MFGRFVDVFADLLHHRHDPVYLRWYFRHARSLRKFKDIHKGDDCFVIGNGPSLNRMDLNLLNDYHTFGLNKIFLMFGRATFRPTYHVAVNPLVIQQSAKEFESLQCPSFLSYRPSRKIVKALDHINYIFTGGPVTFCQDLTAALNEGWTVTYVAMQIAYYMGFNNVFLVGVDHNFTTTGAPNEQQRLTGPDANHFDPEYFGNQEWHLPDLRGSEISFHLAKFFYERDGRNIYDATVAGKLQIFSKLSYEDAIAFCKKK